VGAAELRKRPVKPKMPRFLDGGSMMSFVGSETRREAETRWADGAMGSWRFRMWAGSTGSRPCASSLGFGASHVASGLR
jgi:hypothetical protein